jgi:hypothetical protein
MRVFTVVLVLIFSFQSWTKADDISDFEIEGMSVGDSLLDYMTENQIINNDNGLYPKNSKFFELEYNGKKNTYDHVLFHLKRKDAKYIIYLLRAVNIVDNKNQCMKIKKKIVSKMKNLFVNTNFQEGVQKHYYYKNSTQYISQFVYGYDGTTSDHARVECVIMHEEDIKKYGSVPDTLEVVIQTKEFGIWLETQ